MKGQIFRIAHLGYFDFPDLFAMVAELELILAANGHPVKLGTGAFAGAIIENMSSVQAQAV